MKLRAPAYPLITSDPYFSVWSMTDRLNADETRHWTGKIQSITGTASIDGADRMWMGDAALHGMPAMEQVSVDFSALSTVYVFSADGVELTATFTSPLLPDDLDILSRPVTYLDISVRSADGADHTVSLHVSVAEEICLDTRGQMPVTADALTLPGGIRAGRMGSAEQPVLEKKGDDLRIDWGYFYLAACGPSACVDPVREGNVQHLEASVLLTAGSSEEHTLFLFAYDDLYALQYFSGPVRAYWKRDGMTAEELLVSSLDRREELAARSRAFSERLAADAKAAGGERYAELLSLAYRQVIAAHKLAVDETGEVLFISKECFSNGCAATVDVSYPSVPMFLIYAPELVKGMMRPIFRYAGSGAWPFDFAPHDAGRYPVITGQVYSSGTDPARQMPVEECGNMLIMAAAVCLAQHDASFASENMPLLAKWAAYLLRHGADPDNQLCTDDFAGHLAHNCNLSVKAIMAIASYGILLGMTGDRQGGADLVEKARGMASEWVRTAANGNGSFRLTFDRPGSFSMKYNAIWDKIFGTGIFPNEAIQAECKSYLRKLNHRGLPLDSRSACSKTDWILWTASLCDDPDDFTRFTDSLWDMFHESSSRVPMTDYYDTLTGLQIGNQHRSVQGGLFIRLLDFLGICSRRQDGTSRYRNMP